MTLQKTTVLKLAALWVSTLACSFYIWFYVRAAYVNQSLLDGLQIDAASAGVYTALILVSGLVSFLLSHHMLKKLDVTGMQLAVILTSAIAFSISFRILSEMYIIRY